MKQVLTALIALYVLSACQKQLGGNNETQATVVASDAVTTLNCHTISLSTDYPAKPREVPPFSFVKTQYPDLRIKTIRMMSRKNPVHPAFKKEAVELIGTFTYGSNNTPNRPYAPHVAYLKGTSEVWEYYKTTSGAGARKSVSKRNINYKIYLTPEGYCTAVIDLDLSTPDHEYERVYIRYTDDTKKLMQLMTNNIEDGFLHETKVYYPVQDKYGDILSFTTPYNTDASYYRLTYNYSIPTTGKKYSFIPSQNLISQDYSLMEVMQWLPQSNYQRKSAGGTFFVNGMKVNQDQAYQNFKFDAKQNLVSVTYTDNVLQKTSWQCQN